MAGCQIMQNTFITEILSDICKFRPTMCTYDYRDIDMVLSLKLFMLAAVKSLPMILFFVCTGSMVHNFYSSNRQQADATSFLFRVFLV